MYKGSTQTRIVYMDSEEPNKQNRIDFLNGNQTPNMISNPQHSIFYQGDRLCLYFSQ